LLSGLLTLTLSAQTLDGIASSYHKAPTPRLRSEVLHYAEVHAADRNGALALLTLGATEVDLRQFGDALHHLAGLEKRLPELADYVAYLSAASQSGLQAYGDTEKLLEPVWNETPRSPLIAKAAVLQAGSYMETNQAAKAVAILSQHLADLPDTQAEQLLAHAYEASGDPVNAEAQYRKIYVQHPLAKEAADAQAALARFAALPPQDLLSRAGNLIDGGDYARAVRELTPLLAQLIGADLDLARLRIGIARFQARDTRLALTNLEEFHAAAADVEAQRLYYQMECQRRLDRTDDMTATLEKLATGFPQSHWYEQALISSANYDSLHNQADTADNLFRACSSSFSNDPAAAQCHWRVTWATYLRDAAGAEGMLKEHVQRYPQSDRASSALYFLGRIAESRSDWSASRAIYEAIDRWYPNYYYAVLARERLGQTSIAAAQGPSQASLFLAGLHLSAPKIDGFDSSAITKRRVDRAHLLLNAGLEDEAESELLYGAKIDGQPQIIAMELAELANRRDAPNQGIRYIKHYAPTYLSLPLASAPPKFWELAFPIPYRHELEQYCESLSLDPYLVAALIRQESEFNPKAVSRANARGLTQVMPSTGRQLSRKLGLHGYTTSKLFVPDTNLKIGTYYLKALSDQLDGKWEATLASYNAGKSRVVSWLSGSNFREPAEFVESIPFTETRVYVQSVLRNAEVYRRLYGPAAH
jgi:soluble lytic murein transglycosylase